MLNNLLVVLETAKAVESSSQFSREYSRLFSLPPVREISKPRSANLTNRDQIRCETTYLPVNIDIKYLRTRLHLPLEFK